MALVYRVNAKFSPLLSTYYCKCTVNIKKFRCKSNFVVQSEEKDPDNVIKEPISFEKMIERRRSQASRSILVQLKSSNYAEECKDLCRTFGNIVNAFHYTTKIDQCNFLLLEYEGATSAKTLVHATKYLHSGEQVPVPTTNLWYQEGIRQYGPRKHLKRKPTITKYGHPLASTKQISEKLESMDSISKQMFELYNIVKSSDLDTRLRFYTAQQLELCFSGLIPELIVVPFGSSVNGFGQMGCDLDLVCRFMGQKNYKEKAEQRLNFLTKHFHFNEKAQQKEFLSLLAKILENLMPAVSKVNRILEARVPILKFQYKYTNMYCDLSCTNVVALYMSELLYIYANLDWRVRPLIYTIRKWAKQTKITQDAPGQWITNFSLTLLIIAYLQKKEILPPITTLTQWMNNTGNSIIPRKISSQTSSSESLETLLYDFFVHYSKFDFSMNAICVREGTNKPKRDSSPLYIINPLEQMLNVSRNVSWNEITHFKNSIHNAMHTIDTYPEKAIPLLLGISVAKPYTKKSRTASELVNNNEHSTVTTNDKINNSNVETNDEVKQSESININCLPNKDDMDGSNQLKEIIK